MTSRSAFRFPSVAQAIERKRNELASEVLLAAPSGERSIGAHLFVDALLERFIACGQDGDVESLLHWLNASIDRSNPARPPFDVARAVVPVLQAATNSIDRESETSAAIAALAGALAAFRDDIKRDDEPSLDETDAAIGKVMRVLDERDPLTAEHSRAVASWCGRIARRLNLGDMAVVEATRSGMVHDIGKLRVPLHVLRAPRKLTNEEWDMMRAHVDFGDQMATEEEALHQFRPGIRYHHERIAGGGYPYGYSGDDIPLMARIVSVADAFNAMIGRRPYRPPILPSMALFELQRSAGEQFDPEIVTALEAVLSPAND